MNKTLLPLLFSVLLASCAYSAEPVEGSTRNLYAEKVKFENHSYIHFAEPWPSSCHFILHDPECPVCVKERLFFISEIMTPREKDKLSKKK